FFYAAVARRVLLSFPTRRSSDLPGSGLSRSAAPRCATGRCGRRGENPLQLVDPAEVGAADEESRCAVTGSLPAWGVDRQQRIETDRKSTRLNSSHQIISYAVLCL